MTTQHDLRETVAAQFHVAWAHWMTHLLDQCAWRNQNAIIHKEDVERWMRQIETDYKDLSEWEKESDRAEADKLFLALNEVAGDIDNQTYAIFAKLYQARDEAGRTHTPLVDFLDEVLIYAQIGRDYYADKT
jgi:ribosomal protein L16 Arg81 hydroxylase